MAAVNEVQVAQGQVKEILFPPFRLDLKKEQLWHESQKISLRPKTFAILRYLANHPEQLVSKKELLHAIWDNTQVSEDGLRDYLREIRSALDDDPDAPRVIETVRGRGWRFIASTSSNLDEEVLEQTLSPTCSRTSVLIVLPFMNLNHDPELGYFADGFTEDLTEALAQISGFVVLTRNAVCDGKGTTVNKQPEEKALQAHYVVAGSVRKCGNLLRTSVQLSDAAMQSLLWAAHYDRELSDSFAGYDEIVQQIVETLRSRLI